jgi:hypothetical protein
MSPVEKQTYEEELKIMFGAICDGFRQEVRHRQLMVYQFPTEENDNFPLNFEKERGIVNVMAFHVRTVGFLVRMENWWCTGDEKLKNKTPDLDIWLPNIGTDFFLEVKRIDTGISLKAAKNKIKRDLDKLLKAEKEEDRYSGILTFGFAETKEQEKELLDKYSKISNYIEKYENNSFRKMMLKPVSLENTCQTKLKCVIIGLWYRPKGVAN